MSETAEAPVVEQTSEQGSASLSAGFNKVRGTPPTESPPADEPKQEAAAEPEAQATESDATAEVDAQADTPAEEPIAGLGLTATEIRTQLAGIGELRSALEAKERKLQGQMGSLKSEFLEIVKSAKTETPATVARVNATLKNLRAGGYDELADVLEKDLADVQAAPAGSVDADAIKAQFEATLNTKLAEQRAEYEQKRIEKEVRVFTKAHPDWKTLQVTDDFRIWRGLQPADVQAELAKSTDADFLIDQFSAFKGWKKKADPTATKQKNTARLEGNVTPQGVPSPAHAEPNAKQSLAAGFNKVRRLGG